MDIEAQVEQKYRKELDTPGTHMEVKKTDVEDLIREIRTLRANKIRRDLEAHELTLGLR